MPLSDFVSEHIDRHTAGGSHRSLRHNVLMTLPTTSAIIDVVESLCAARDTTCKGALESVGLRMTYMWHYRLKPQQTRGNSRLSENSAVKVCLQSSHSNSAGWRQRRLLASSIALLTTGSRREGDVERGR